MREFDPEALEMMRRYCGGDPRIAHRITDEVLCEYPTERWSVPEFLALIQKAVETIPEQDRSTAVVRLHEDSGKLTISYARDENAAEIDERVNSAYTYVEEKRASERATYEQLKQKFG